MLKLREKMQKRMGGESGFTLIELLVVIIIIAILAAIAIPMYLSQRKKGWKSNVYSDLQNAAVAEESYFSDNGSYSTGTVATVLTALANQGFKKSSNVTFDSFTAGSGNTYVMTAHHNSYSGCTITYDSAVGAPTDAATGCT